MNQDASSTSAQAIVDGLWKHITTERETLLTENKELTSINSTLVFRNTYLEGELEKVNKKRAGGGSSGRELSDALNDTDHDTDDFRRLESFARGSAFIPFPPSVNHNSFRKASHPDVSSWPKAPSNEAPSSSATQLPNAFDGFPNEILVQILHHLHQPFHFFHYSNAILGIAHPSLGSTPWNPVGLQLVCRRWRDIARPLFYNQVAFDSGDKRAIRLGAEISQGCLNDHPLKAAKVLVWSEHAWSSASGSRFFFERLADRDKEDPPLDLLVVAVSGLPRNLTERTSSLKTAVVLRNGSASNFAALMKGNSGICGSFGREQLLKSWPWRCHPSHCLAVRLPSSDLPSVLNAILQNLDHVTTLPGLQLDFPFPLPPSLLNAVFPILTSILRHPSLHEGRDYVFDQVGTTKKVVLGTKSEKERRVLKGKVGQLGKLEVVVEVVVLEL